MSQPGRRFDPRELLGVDGLDLGDAELADALAAARIMEAGIVSDSVDPSPGFEERVMAAIAQVDAPHVMGATGSFLATVRSAWQITVSGGRPLATRAQALAFVLLVAVATLSLGGLGAAGVGALLGEPVSTPAPSVAPTQSATPSPSAIPSPSPSLSPSPSPSASESAAPTETAEATETLEPDETAEPTDDNSGPGGGGGNSGPGGGSSGPG